jgi:hypothetical protein
MISTEDYLTEVNSMASEDSSFNASGPTVVAFETITGPGDRSFGVSVSGSVCGVYGQGVQGNNQNDQITPGGTGVLGVGDTHGVYGATNFVDIATEAPDFGPMPGMGVIGINQTAYGGQESPAILGLNDVLKNDFAAGFSGAAVSDATRKPVAVEGLSRTGHGVCGLTLDLTVDRTVDLSDSPNVNEVLDGNIGTDPGTGLPDTTNPSGVIGIAMTGPGLRGVSLTDRGAIFQSATLAATKENNPLVKPPPPVGQIRLVPHVVSLGNVAPGATPALPKNAKIGDLLALASPDGNFQTRANLYFCVGNEGGVAVWGQLAFASTSIGTA